MEKNTIILILIIFVLIILYNCSCSNLVQIPLLNNIKVDVVYTWVNGNDPLWKERKNKITGPPKGDSIFRYNSVDELKYSLRSVYRYAPWVNIIYIVVDDVQKPSFVNEDNPKIKIIKHSDIIPKEYLPTFNSVAIETCLHHIPGLQENFLYFNDDVFLGNNVSIDDLYNKCYYRNVKYTDLVPQDGEWMCNLKTDYLLLRNEYPDTKFIVPWHMAHFCKKSLMYELEEMFPENYTHTISQKLRKQRSDIICKSICLPCMQYNLGVVKGIYKMIPDKKSDSMGVELGDKDTSDAVKRLDLINKNKYKFFCINNSIHNDILSQFLEQYFPEKCPYEK